MAYGILVGDNSHAANISLARGNVCACGTGLLRDHHSTASVRDALQNSLTVLKDLQVMIVQYGIMCVILPQVHLRSCAERLLQYSGG